MLPFHLKRRIVIKRKNFSFDFKEELSLFIACPSRLLFLRTIEILFDRLCNTSRKIGTSTGLSWWPSGTYRIGKLTKITWTWWARSPVNSNARSPPRCITWICRSIERSKTDPNLNEYFTIMWARSTLQLDCYSPVIRTAVITTC